MDDSIEKQVRKGQAVQELLDNPLIIEAFDGVEKRCIQEWRGTPLQDTARREAIFFRLQALDVLRTELGREVDSGKMAQARIKQTRK